MRGLPALPAAAVHEIALVVLYGLLAAASPTVLLATLVVLGSGRGRLNGIVFAVAFLVGQTFTFVIAYFVGSQFTPDRGSRPFADVLELVGGVLLLVLGWRRRSTHPTRPAPETRRTEALFARLDHVRPALSFSVGLPLGIGAKRLILTILAATTIAAGSLSGVEDASLGVLYIGIASLAVLVPVAVYLLLGNRADGAVSGARRWIVAHEDALTVYSALGVGALLVADALVSLLS